MSRVVASLIFLAEAIFYGKIYIVMKNRHKWDKGFSPIAVIETAKPKKRLVRGVTIAAAMIIVSIITLLAIIVIPRFLSSRMGANESAARAGLKTIAAALENFAEETKQGYPTDISVLITADPPYLNKNYIADSPVQGYNYTCESLGVSGYSCSAEPQHCARTGSKIYEITTGGVFTETECSQ